MCDPTAIAIGSFAIKTAGNIADAAAQNRNASANKAAAIASQVGQINDINLRQIQEKQAAGQELDVAARKTRTALSSARLSAGEAGVSGVSVDALLTDIGNEGSTYSQDVKLNEANTQKQLERQKLGIYAQTQDRINSVQGASPFATGLRIGGDAIGLATQFASRQAPSDGTPNISAPTVGPNASSMVGATPNGFIPPTFRIRPRPSVYGK